MRSMLSILLLCSCATGQFWTTQTLGPGVGALAMTIIPETITTPGSAIAAIYFGPPSTPFYLRFVPWSGGSSQSLCVPEYCRWPEISESGDGFWVIGITDVVGNWSMTLPVSGTVGLTWYPQLPPNEPPSLSMVLAHGAFITSLGQVSTMPGALLAVW
jgi:hypothetical protein